MRYATSSGEREETCITRRQNLQDYTHFRRRSSPALARVVKQSQQ